MISVLVLSLLSWGFEALDIQGDSTCPTPGEVAGHVEPLLSPNHTFHSGLRLRVDAVPSTTLEPSSREIEVRLESSGERQPLASRRLERSGSCGQLAEAVAVVVASWAGHYETPSFGELGLPDGLAADVAVHRTPDTSKTESGMWSLGGAAGLGGAADGGATPHAGIEITVQRRTDHWFARLATSGTGERLFPVATGAAHWWRVFVMPSLGRVWGDALFFEASAGPVIGPVFVRGRGFSPNDGDVGLDVGVSPALRLGFRLGAASHAHAWLGASAIGWLRPHRLSVDLAMDRPTLPWLDVLAGGGLTYSLGP